MTACSVIDIVCPVQVNHVLLQRKGCGRYIVGGLHMYLLLLVIIEFVTTKRRARAIVYEGHIPESARTRWSLGVPH